MKIYNDDIAKQSDVNEQAAKNSQLIEQIGHTLTQHATDLDNIDAVLANQTVVIATMKKSVFALSLLVGILGGAVLGMLIL
jgi:hypothetical protein